MGVALAIGILFLAISAVFIAAGVNLIMRQRGWRRRLLVSVPAIILATFPFWIWEI